MTSEIVAKVLVVNDSGEALILRRSKQQNITPGFYRPELSHTPDLPGGLVGDEDIAESEKTAAQRELLEETGLDIGPENLTLVFAKTYKKKTDDLSKTKLLYITKVSGRPEVKLSWEHEALEWCPINQIIVRHKLVKHWSEAIEYLIKFDLI